MAGGYHPAGMDVERAGELYGLAVIVAMVGALLADIALLTIHTLALHGRRTLPGGVTRTVGWVLTGLSGGLFTLSGFRRCSGSW